MTTRMEDLPVAPRGMDGPLSAVRGRLPLVCALSLAFGIAMAVLSFYVTPVYRGTTVLAPADTEKKGMGSGLSSVLGSVSGIAALAGIGMGGGDYATEEAIAVLKSQQFTEEFIDHNNLLPELFPKSWDAGTGHWKAGIKKIPTLGKGFHAFDRIRKIEHDNKTGLITLQIEWKDPVKAAEWANRLAERLNTEMRTRALTQAEASLGYLQKEAASTVDVTTREAISRLMESEIKQEMLAHVTTDYALQVVDKAIPADIDDPVRPIKVLYAALGLVFGVMVGTVIAMWLDKRKFVHRSGPDGYHRSI